MVIYGRCSVCGQLMPGRPCPGHAGEFWPHRWQLCDRHPGRLELALHEHPAAPPVLFGPAATCAGSLMLARPAAVEFVRPEAGARGRAWCLPCPGPSMTARAGAPRAARALPPGARSPGTGGCTMTDPADPRLRFRLWINAVLVDDVWVDTSHPRAQAHADATQRRQLAAAERAAERGDVWLIDVYDPARPPGEDHLRFGSDRAGMTDPRPVDTLALPDLDHPWSEGPPPDLPPGLTRREPPCP